MSKQYKTAAMAAIHETALGMREVDVIAKETMKTFDEMCLSRSPECAEERSMITDFLIRPEAASDREGVEELLFAAFPTSLELRLVRQLREDADVVFSLVAVEAAGVIGHALFSRLRAPAAALGLGPIAVTAKRRCRGVAAAMIEAGLERAKAEGWAAVVVVGDPSYSIIRASASARRLCGACHANTPDRL